MATLSLFPWKVRDSISWLAWSGDVGRAELSTASPVTVTDRVGGTSLTGAVAALSAVTVWGLEEGRGGGKGRFWVSAYPLKKKGEEEGPGGAQPARLHREGTVWDSVVPLTGW